jgi:hypothetical protein
MEGIEEHAVVVVDESGVPQMSVDVGRSSPEDVLSFCRSRNWRTVTVPKKIIQGGRATDRYQVAER